MFDSQEFEKRREATKKLCRENDVVVKKILVLLKENEVQAWRVGTIFRQAKDKIKSSIKQNIVNVSD